MLALCVKEGQQQEAEKFFRLYLDALDEELLALLASTGHKSATATPIARERGVSQSGQTDMGKRGFVVRQIFHFSLRGAWNC